MSIDILLATCQGANYLKPLLDSLFAQTEQGFRILARDDASKDGTLQILQDYAHANPERVHIYAGDERVGAAQNFSRLLAASQAEYAMFCDQDDVWDRDKIARSLRLMKAREAVVGEGVPVLVHTDSRVADAGLKPMRDSFHATEAVQPERTDLRRLLVQNTVQGCTVMMNRALVQFAFPVPAEARMHDQWCALVCAMMGGEIAYLGEPTLTYRQHAGNAVGVRGFSLRDIRARARAAERANLAQANALLLHCTSQLPQGHANIQAVRVFKVLEKLPRLLRPVVYMSGRYLRRPWWENAGLM